MKMWKRLSSIILVAILIAALAACSTSPATVAPDVPEDEPPITIVGLGEQDVEIALSELKQLEAVTLEASGLTSSGELKKPTVTGPTLSSILEKHDSDLQKYTGIRLVASDGYAIDVPPEVFKENEIVLAYEYDGEPLDEKSGPIRAIIPDVRTMYWARMLSKIELIQATTAADITRVVFLETAATKLEQYDYTYYDSQDKAIKVSELLALIENDDNAEAVALKAEDGLEKTERMSIFSQGYLKTTGDEAPVFLSPDIPKGMHVKNLMWVKTETDAVVSVSKALSALELNTADDKTGISLAVIAEELGLTEGDTYVLTAEDGYSVEISASDLPKGVVYTNDGVVRVHFTELPKNYSVKHLMYFEAKPSL